MLLRCESLEPPMSQLGQTEKNSLRANVVRVAPARRLVAVRRRAVPVLAIGQGPIHGGNNAQQSMRGGYLVYPPFS
jgi:hypothetical protein